MVYFAGGGGVVPVDVDEPPPPPPPQAASATANSVAEPSLKALRKLKNLCSATLTSGCGKFEWGVSNPPSTRGIPITIEAREGARQSRSSARIPERNNFMALDLAVDVCFPHTLLREVRLISNLATLVTLATVGRLCVERSKNNAELGLHWQAMRQLCLGRNCTGG